MRSVLYCHPDFPNEPAVAKVSTYGGVAIRKPLHRFAHRLLFYGFPAVFRKFIIQKWLLVSFGIIGSFTETQKFVEQGVSAIGVVDGPPNARKVQTDGEKTGWKIIQFSPKWLELKNPKIKKLVRFYRNRKNIHSIDQNFTNVSSNRWANHRKLTIWTPFKPAMPLSLEFQNIRHILHVSAPCHSYSHSLCFSLTFSQCASSSHVDQNWNNSFVPRK